VEVYQRFGSAYCLHHQGDHTEQHPKKTVIFNVHRILKLCSMFVQPLNQLGPFSYLTHLRSLRHKILQFNLNWESSYHRIRLEEAQLQFMDATGQYNESTCTVVSRYRALNIYNIVLKTSMSSWFHQSNNAYRNSEFGVL
jgi:hypothetical protein